MLNAPEMHRFVDPNITIHISATLFQMKCVFIDKWNKVVYEESAKRGIEGNKLLTFKQLKQRYGTDLYATHIFKLIEER